MVALRRLTLAEQAYEELQEQIVSGRLPAGHRLLADELAGALAISQTPVKEALSRLEHDGLVEGESRRGSVVRRFTLADIEEIYEARLLLETYSLTTGVAACRVTKEFVDALAANFAGHLAELDKQTAAGLAEAIRLDREFHKLLVGIGKNRLIGRWHGIVLRQTQTIRNYAERRRRTHVGGAPVTSQCEPGRIPVPPSGGFAHTFVTDVPRPAGRGRKGGRRSAETST
jgi:DNA-binding GntR family transcriptional regulator